MMWHNWLPDLDEKKYKFKTYFSTFIFLSKISRLIFDESFYNFTGLFITFKWREPCLRFFI